MTNAEVDALMKYGDEIGRDIDDFMARTVLGAKEIIAKDPKNTAALTVIKDFADFLRTGNDSGGFEPFLLPHFETDEEKEENTRFRDAHLTWKAEHA